jgi:glyoxylase-like metal-dependent hydrolase (beta-lactamase superfamily II)
MSGEDQHGDDQYEVVIVKYGTRSTVKSDVFLNHHIYAEPDLPQDMDYFFWVVRNRARTVVVDTGFSAAGGAARNRTSLVDPIEALGLLGLPAERVETVLVTHAHYDHIGNLDRLPAAGIVLSAAEYAFWTSPMHARAQFHHSIEDAELRALAAAEQAGRITQFSDRYQVAPGIELIEVGGHTPGQSVVLVQTADGPVLLASDAVHFYEEYTDDKPFAYVANLVDMYAGFDRIRALMDSGQVRHLVSGHDPETLGRFNPLDGPLAGLAATIGSVS